MTKAAVGTVLGGLTLTTFLRTGLIVLTWLATTTGLWDVAAVDISNWQNEFIKIFIVVMVSSAIILAMVKAIDAMLDRSKRFSGRAFAVCAYFFFACWSVGFGYGFFWKNIAAAEFTSSQFDRVTKAANKRVNGAIVLLSEAQLAVTEASATSNLKAEEELEEGGSCENNQDSDVGKGPLQASRLRYRDGAAKIARVLEANWVGPLVSQQQPLTAKLQALNSNLSSGSRSGISAEELKALRNIGTAGLAERERLLQEIIDETNAFIDTANKNSDIYQEQTVQDLQSLIEDMTLQRTRKLKAFCEDKILAGKLADAQLKVRNIKSIPNVNWTFVEGQEATRYAFKNLALNAIHGLNNVYASLKSNLGFQSSMDNIEASLTEFSDLGDHGLGRQDLNENDLISFFAAIAVDFALLFVAIISRLPATGLEGPPKKVKGKERKKQVRQGQSYNAEATKQQARLNKKQAEAEKTLQAALVEREEVQASFDDVNDTRHQRAIDGHKQSRNSVRSLTGLGEKETEDFLNGIANCVMEIDGIPYLVMFQTAEKRLSVREKSMLNYATMMLGVNQESSRVPSGDPVLAEIKQQLYVRGDIEQDEEVELNVIELKSTYIFSVGVVRERFDSSLDKYPDGTPSEGSSSTGHDEQLKNRNDQPEQSGSSGRGPEHEETSDLHYVDDDWSFRLENEHVEEPKEPPSVARSGNGGANLSEPLTPEVATETGSPEGWNETQKARKDVQKEIGKKRFKSSGNRLNGVLNIIGKANPWGSKR